jgi:hypothetical protein
MVLRSYLWFVSANKKKDALFPTDVRAPQQRKPALRKMLSLRDISFTLMPLKEILRKPLSSPRLNKNFRRIATHVQTYQLRKIEQNS